MSYDDTSMADLDRARSELGDTGEPPELSDDHIEMVIAELGFNLGMASLADELAVIYTRKPSSVHLPSGLSVTWTERVQELRRIAARYRALAAQETAAASIPLSSRAKTIAVW
jgi:hypothetical protein